MALFAGLNAVDDISFYVERETIDTALETGSLWGSPTGHATSSCVAT